ncbi:hypothetical protein [Duganella callida]|uniref:SPOR domain-containing protein n=1 Tax=Duganella callida TaxID=2561932 RepID=A0A4Y9SRD2_9BURK|nr:hypothetical protein [Duganella callida]TFW29025.1 hypothetical protein E4L98_04565 [Duganella callida]
MVRPFVRALLLSASMLAASAGAAILPSELMLPEPARAARGYTESWIFTIDIVGTESNGMEDCRKILNDRGFQATLSKTANSATPALHFKLTGSKEYAQASTEADDTLAAVQQAKCKGTLTWTVTAKQARR